MSAGGALLLTVAAGRNLSVSEFGEYSFCFVLLTMLSIAARFGTDATLLRFGGTAWHDKNRDRFAEYGRFTLGITTRISLALMALGGIGLSLLWNRWDASPTMAWTLLGLLPVSLSLTVSFLFKAAQKPQLGTFLEPGGAYLAIAGIVFAGSSYEFEWTATALAKVQTAVLSLACLAGLFLAWKAGFLCNSSTAESKIDKRGYVLASANFAVVVVMQVMANWGGSLFLELQGDDTQLATFLAALRITTLTVVVLNVITLVVSPRLAGLYSSNPRPEFERLAHQASLTAFLALLFPQAILIFGSQWVMSLFGQTPVERLTYVEHSHLLVIIALGQFVGSFTAVAPALLSMTGHDSELRNSTIVMSLVSIVLAAVLIQLYGAYGAAIATALYQALQSSVTAWIVRRKLGFWPVPSGSTFVAMGRRFTPKSWHWASK